VRTKTVMCMIRHRDVIAISGGGPNPVREVARHMGPLAVVDELSLTRNVSNLDWYVEAEVPVDPSWCLL
jgi:hypothetical protein